MIQRKIYIFLYHAVCLLSFVNLSVAARSMKGSKFSSFNKEQEMNGFALSKYRQKRRPEGMQNYEVACILYRINFMWTIDLALDISFAVSGLNQLVQYSRANIQSEYFFAFFGRVWWIPWQQCKSAWNFHCVFQLLIVYVFMGKQKSNRDMMR